MKNIVFTWCGYLNSNISTKKNNLNSSLTNHMRATLDVCVTLLFSDKRRILISKIFLHMYLIQSQHVYLIKKIL
jgi:hypothetical protein